MQEPDGLEQLDHQVHRAIALRVTKVTLAAVAASLLITIGLGYLISGTLMTPPGLFIAAVVPGVIAPCASFWNISLSYRLELANQRLQSLSETDPLTNTLNRRKFMEVAERELALAERHCYPSSVVIIDFDDFKLVNDKHGHAVGDLALVQSIEVMKSVIRESDILARFGGEEFILMLPHTAREGAQSLAQRILDKVEQTPVELDEGSVCITLSAGSVTCETSCTPLDVLMSRADELLYKSKQNGRNQCTTETIVNLVPQFRRA